MAIGHLELAPALIDQVHDRLLAAIVDGSLPPGRRLTQEGLAEMLGVSRQPVSHAIQVLRRRGLLIDAGRKGVAVAPVDAERIGALYVVREALDALAARLAAERVATGAAPKVEIERARTALDTGLCLGPEATLLAYIDADVAFHSALHALSGNSAIGETVAEQWPHFKRSMAAVLVEPERRPRIWQEHDEIFAAIRAGDAARAEGLARAHTARARSETEQRLPRAAVA